MILSLYSVKKKLFFFLHPIVLYNVAWARHVNNTASVSKLFTEDTGSDEIMRK